MANLILYLIEYKEKSLIVCLLKLNHVKWVMYEINVMKIEK